MPACVPSSAAASYSGQNRRSDGASSAHPAGAGRLECSRSPAVPNEGCPRSPRQHAGRQRLARPPVRGSTAVPWWGLSCRPAP
eukprot:scaffold123162_cov66-Phaeocystis_antarctica.AAC.2